MEIAPMMRRRRFMIVSLALAISGLAAPVQAQTAPTLIVLSETSVLSFESDDHDILKPMTGVPVVTAYEADVLQRTAAQAATGCPTMMPINEPNQVVIVPLGKPVKTAAGTIVTGPIRQMAGLSSNQRYCVYVRAVGPDGSTRSSGPDGVAGPFGWDGRVAPSAPSAVAIIP